MSFKLESDDALDIGVVRGPHTTIALVKHRTSPITGRGDSKRAPGDKASRQIGDNLAIARACIDYGNQVLAAANEASANLNPEPQPTFAGQVAAAGDVWIERTPLVLDVEPDNVDGIAATIPSEHDPVSFNKDCRKCSAAAKFPDAW